MTFTKQDALTFFVGAGIAVALSVAEVLVGLDGQDFSNVEWAGVLGNIAIGSLAALGRYLATRLPEVLAKSS